MKILFVCECNICRSPMAEFIFKDMTRGMADIQIASAAVSGERAGSPVYPPARECLKKHGIPFEDRRAVKFQLKDYFEYDYIITMDEWNKYNLRGLCDKDLQRKIFKLLEFSDRNTEGMSRDNAAIHTDILDPHMRGNFERAYIEIREGCIGL
ncbi:MAG: low molecular weight protein-tyrosine-phosphatase, partial [Candidatus Ornithomonoglobus sp.]